MRYSTGFFINKGISNIPKWSLSPRTKYGINFGGNPAMSKAHGFLLEFTPMKIGAGMTFLGVVITKKSRKGITMNIKRTLTVILSAWGAALLDSAIAYASAPPHNKLPEPATFALLGAGLAGLVAYKLIRKHKK
jgi:hypothetical protein